MNTWQQTMATPLGDMLAETDGIAVNALNFDMPPATPGPVPAAAQAVLDDLERWLDRYFEGIEEPFARPLAPAGTPFQREVWNALCGIPYAKTVSYAEIARRIGRPTAVRAVGAANGRNPVSILIPCHRVIGTDGSLTGYGGGLHRKRSLIALEQQVRFALVA